MKTASIPAVLFAAMTLTLSAQSGGNLTPPAGAPGKTMKSLDEVEARTAISAIPFTISTPGSYYLTKNLSSTTDGITITANNVTLDLNGFTLNGSGTSIHHEGVMATGTSGSPLQNIAISNGVISGFGNSIEFSYVNNSLLTQLRCSNSAAHGIQLTGQSGQCDGNTVSKCSVSKAGGVGIYLNGENSGQCDGNTVSNCSTSNSGGIALNGYNGQCDGNSVINCRVSHSSDVGISLIGGGSSGQCDGNSLINCHVSNSSNAGIQLSGSNSGQCNGNTVSNCKVSNAAFSGIYLSGSSGQCNGNTVNNCNFSNSGGNGIALSGGSSGQCDGNTVSNCRSSNSGDSGILLSPGSNGNTVSSCNVSNSAGIGIELDGGFSGSNQLDGNHLLNNTVRGADFAGVYLLYSHSCRVEGNHVSGVTSSGTSYGIRLLTYTGEKNLVIKNSCSGQADNFALDSDDTNGPEVSASGTLSTTGAAAHPWANFSH